MSPVGVPALKWPPVLITTTPKYIKVMTTLQNQTLMPPGSFNLRKWEYIEDSVVLSISFSELNIGLWRGPWGWTLG